MEENKGNLLDLSEGKLDTGILVYKEEYTKKDKTTGAEELNTKCVIQCGKGMNIELKKVWSIKGKLNVNVGEPVMFQVATYTFNEKTTEKVFNVRKPLKFI